jgi:hypothetical protein
LARGVWATPDSESGPIGFFARLAQGAQEPASSLVAQEDGFAPIPPVHHLVNRTGTLNPELLSHAEGIVLLPAGFVKRRAWAGALKQ